LTESDVSQSEGKFALFGGDPHGGIVRCSQGDEQAGRDDLLLLRTSETGVEKEAVTFNSSFRT
jgi:hypothetical protein